MSKINEFTWKNRNSQTGKLIQMDAIGPVSAIQQFFGNVTTAEIKALSQEDRLELAGMIAPKLKVVITVAEAYE